jgi:hypothetical protein
LSPNGAHEDKVRFVGEAVAVAAAETVAAARDAAEAARSMTGRFPPSPTRATRARLGAPPVSKEGKADGRA